MSKIMVWDWPVRIGHWLMAAGFALAWVTSESESLRLVHVAAGATVMAVAAFRLLWGFVGSRYARFADFVRGPQAVLSYLRSLLTPQPQHHIGHNPAGGWAILALLACALATACSGWLVYEDIGGHWLEGLHEGLAGLMLGVVAVHIAGVVASSVLHRENLVRAMLTGCKEGKTGESIASVRPLAVLFLLAWIGIAGWVVAT
jgi:cytochrome b